MAVHVTTRTVQFGDCDPAGAIYMPRIAHFVVEAILEFQSVIFGGPAARRIFSMGVLPPARHLSIEFVGPLTYDDKIEMKVSCTDVRDTSFTCDVEAAREDGQVSFRARLTQVCVSPETKRPVQIPESMRAALLTAR